MKVFLTGVAGFIGQAIVRKVYAHGWEVHALVRDVKCVQVCRMAENGYTLVAGDVTRREGLVE